MSEEKLSSIMNIFFATFSSKFENHRSIEYFLFSKDCTNRYSYNILEKIHFVWLGNDPFFVDSAF